MLTNESGSLLLSRHPISVEFEFRLDFDLVWHAGLPSWHLTVREPARLDAKIAAELALGKRPAGMKEDEEIVYNLLTEIYRDHDISDATYARAKAKFGEKGIADIQGLASYYGITAMALITARATYPAGDEPKLAAAAFSSLAWCALWRSSWPCCSRCSAT